MADGSIRRRRQIIKLGVGVAACVPLALTVYRFFTDRLGANPIAEALNTLGLWTLIVLLSCLACTPLNIVFGWKWPLPLRRLLGLSAFAYGCLHFLVYIGADQFFDWRVILVDVVKRKFMTVGFAALLLMLPLAITSTNKMVKRLGFARWKRLHRLIYVAAILGVIHFIWRVKADTREPLIYAGVLVVLLAVRLIPVLRSPQSSSA